MSGLLHRACQCSKESSSPPREHQGEEPMRFIKAMLTSASMLLASGLTALTAQDPPIKVDVHTSETHTTWYTDPMWLAIGGAVLLLIIVLAVMAARGRRSTTTVIR